MAFQIRKGAPNGKFSSACHEATLANRTRRTSLWRVPWPGKGAHAVGKGRGSTPAFLPVWEHSQMNKHLWRNPPGRPKRGRFSRRKIGPSWVFFNSRLTLRGKRKRQAPPTPQNSRRLARCCALHLGARSAFLVPTRLQKVPRPRSGGITVSAPATTRATGPLKSCRFATVS